MISIEGVKKNNQGGTMLKINWENKDAATIALVDPMLDDIGLSEPKVREAAKRYAIHRIVEDSELSYDALEMGDLQYDTNVFIDGYKQALKDLGRL